MNDLSSPLPALNDTVVVKKGDIDAFRQNGHVLLKNLLNKQEQISYRQAVRDAVRSYNTETRKLEERDTYGKAFLQIMNLWQHDAGVKQFSLAKRFAGIAADLLGVGNVRLYHDQALIKEPGGGPTPWHQDQYYFPVDTHNTVTMWMPMVDISADMGMLTFASGSHKKGYALDKEISDESESAFSNIIHLNNYAISMAETMRAGDATFHYGYTIHKALANLSNKSREVMTVIYVADGARIIKPQHQWQEADHQVWLMGKPVGDFVDSALNPLLL